MAVADFDNDGDLDMVINNNPGDNGIEDRARAILYRNNVGQRRNWIAFDLRGTRSNRDAIGAVVRIEAGGHRQMRYVIAGSGYASQNTSRLYLGLKDSAQVDSITVEWPDGQVERFENVKARQLVRITQGGGLAAAAFETRRAAL
jgi:hypothetical protein